MPMPFSAMEEETARMAREARRTLDDQVQRIEAAGGRVAEAHLQAGGAPEDIVALAEDLRAGLVVMGRGQGRDKKSLDGKRFKFGGLLHLLPRPHSAQRRHDRLRGYRAREELVRR